MENIEIWKEIPSCWGLYEASNLGRIRSKDHIVEQMGNGCMVEHFYKGRIIKQRLNVNGYYMCCVSNGKNKCTRLVHRLVAEAFIPNPYDYPCINHINELKDDNRVKNLQWCTLSMNQRAGSVPLRKSLKHCKPISQYYLDGRLKDSFPSRKVAAICTGIQPCNISACLKGRRKHAGGYVWRYDK